MNYRVTIANRAASKLTGWIFIERETGHGSTRIAKAVDEAMETLAFSADEVGESRGGRERVLIVDPVAFIYEVFPQHAAVIIYEAVIHHGRHP